MNPLPDLNQPEKKPTLIALIILLVIGLIGSIYYFWFAEAPVELLRRGLIVLHEVEINALALTLLFMTVWTALAIVRHHTTFSNEVLLKAERLADRAFRACGILFALTLFLY